MVTPVTLYQRCPLPQTIRSSCENRIDVAIASYSKDIYARLDVPQEQRSPEYAVTFLYDQFLTAKAEKAFFAGQAMKGWPDEFEKGFAAAIEMAVKEVVDGTYEEGYDSGRGNNYVRTKPLTYS